jgi:hypothetical protein
MDAMIELSAIANSPESAFLECRYREGRVAAVATRERVRLIEVTADAADPRRRSVAAITDPGFPAP